MMQAGARPSLSATSAHWYFTDGSLAYSSRMTEIKRSIVREK